MQNSLDLVEGVQAVRCVRGQRAQCVKRV